MLAGQGPRTQRKFVDECKEAMATDQIKGHYPAGQALEPTLNRNWATIPLDCRPAYWQLPKENGVGESCLVYVKDGKILRTNHIVTDRQTMSA